MGRAFQLNDKPVSEDELLDDFDEAPSNKKLKYLNVASAFDIEASSFTNFEGWKASTMYAWVYGLNGRIIFGRTWEEFQVLIKKLISKYKLNKNRRLIIYVHNLSYEFQFIKDMFEWDKVFALKERQVCYALYQGIEFRCSYILTGYSLAKVGEQCITYPVNKMVGDLDYSKIRHSKTPLTPKEWKYVANDALVVMSYIQQQIEIEDNNISHIPLTATGYVRRFVRDKCIKRDKGAPNNPKFTKYRKLMKDLIIQSSEEYLQNKRAFIGGHTHGNPLGLGLIHEDVTSMDFTSSYPYVMISEKFPMSRATHMNIKSSEQFYDMIDNYCCIFDITFYDLESTTPYEHWIPSSKTYDYDEMESDNGKVIRAKSISMSLTEVDFKTISNFYTWSKIRISNFKYYVRGYLPKPIIQAILKLYKDKTELKGIDDKFIEYMRSKGNLNSCYGMMVTDICRDEIEYDNDTCEWNKEACNIDKALNKYNKSINRVLFYTWGIYVTAYAKANLASGILELQYDYLYSDTDSVKFLNYEKHKDYFNNYNENVKIKLNKMLKFYKLNPALVEPTNIKGKSKLIGIWDYDGHYRRFKYLGAKRYAYQYDDYTYSFTLSGCSKRLAIGYLASQCRIINKLNKINNKDERVTILDLFSDGMYIPAPYTCKNLHSYLDYHQDGEVKDYLGQTYEYHELSSVHLEANPFTLSVPEQLLDYILGLRGVL